MEDGCPSGTPTVRGVLNTPNIFFCEGQPFLTVHRDHQPPTANRQGPKDSRGSGVGSKEMICTALVLWGGGG